MKFILLSLPNDFPEEQAILVSLFEAGLERFHLRKPDATQAELRSWLSLVPEKFYPRIVLHQQWELAAEMGLGGIHFPEWARKALTQEQWKSWKDWTQVHELSLSTSAHATATLKQLSDIQYVFLSPVYSSISKPGYGPNEELAIKQKYPFDVYALGGVTPSRLPEIAAKGYDGAAFMGAIWREPKQALSVFQ